MAFGKTLHSCFELFLSIFALKISLISRADIMHPAPRQVDDHQMALWELRDGSVLPKISYIFIT